MNSEWCERLGAKDGGLGGVGGVSGGPCSIVGCCSGIF